MPNYKHYNKAPIIEAIIDVRFLEPLTDKSIKKLSNKINKFFPIQIPHFERKVNLEIDNKGKVNVHEDDNQIGFKLHSQDSENILTLLPAQLVLSKMAPYDCWVSFFGLFCEIWKELSKIHKVRSCTRVATRYINR